MTLMRRHTCLALCASIALLLCAPSFAQIKAPLSSNADLRVLLNEFLAGAARNDKAMHERFWADDVTYTSAQGVVRNKAEIMKHVEEPQPPDAPKMTYSAEDVRIHDFGDWAIVNFRLVANSEKDGKTETTNYRNTGTFRRRNGQWQAVAWQATKIAEPAEQKK
jgi:ketosteroid isomerase-like protein